mgnify:CR=1 FL=1
MRARWRFVADPSVVLVALGPVVALEEPPAEGDDPLDEPPPPEVGVAFFVGEAAGLLAGALLGLDAAAFGGVALGGAEPPDGRVRRVVVGDGNVNRNGPDGWG